MSSVDQNSPGVGLSVCVIGDPDPDVAGREGS